MDFSAEYTLDMCAQYFWRFSFYRPALLGIPTLPLAGRKNVAFQRFKQYQKLNFQCRSDKKLPATKSETILITINLKFMKRDPLVHYDENIFLLSCEFGWRRNCRQAHHASL